MLNKRVIVMAEKNETKNETKKPSNTMMLLLMSALVVLLLFNQYQMNTLSGKLAAGGSAGSAALTAAAVGGASPAPSGGAASGSSGSSGSTDLQAIINEVIPTGTPAVYGPELGVSFDKPIESITILVNIDRTVSHTSLTADQLKRYVRVGTSISCEYCCGAQTLVFPDGSMACGCEHSFAMRGLAKYLITKHGSEYTDEQVLGELARWKALFFPQQTVEKELALRGSSQPNSVADLPQQVGGC